MALGLPVVTTTIGAEGLPLVPGEHAQVADTPASFAAAVLGLLRDEPLRAHLAARGRELVEASFSWGAVQSRLRRAYDAVGSSTGTG
jgi:glycosyltransferase involved in cell wall biosynthesis